MKRVVLTPRLVSMSKAETPRCASLSGTIRLCVPYQLPTSINLVRIWPAVVLVQNSKRSPFARSSFSAAAARGEDPNLAHPRKRKLSQPSARTRGPPAVFFLLYSALTSVAEVGKRLATKQNEGPRGTSGRDACLRKWQVGAKHSRGAAIARANCATTRRVYNVSRALELVPKAQSEE